MELLFMLECDRKLEKQASKHATPPTVPIFAIRNQLGTIALYNRWGHRIFLTQIKGGGRLGVDTCNTRTVTVSNHSGIKNNTK